MPILSCVKIEAEKNTLTVSTSNLDEHCTAAIECDGDLASICVPSLNIKNILPILGESVEMEAAGGRLNIKSNGVFVLNAFDPKEFPAPPSDKLKRIGVNCEDLASVIETVSFAASTDEGRQPLMAVHVVCEAKKIIAEASNGREFARIEKLGIAAAAEFQVYNSFVGHFISSLRRKGASLALSEKWMSVTYDGGSYFCKAPESVYPNTASFLKWKHVEIGAIDPKLWSPVFRSAISLDGQDGKLTSRICVSGGRINHKSKSGELDIPTPEKISDEELRLNAVAMVPCLERFEVGKVNLSIANENALSMKQGDLIIMSCMLGKTK